MTNRVIVTITGLTLLSSVSFAATAEQAGTYTGSIKTVVTNGAGGKSVQKETMQLDIAVDDSTTVTIGGVVIPTPTGGFYGATAGAIVYGVDSGGVLTVNVAEFSFKGTSIKGTVTGATVSSGPPPQLVTSVREAKFKLKKQ